uniref:Uncharacterized protein n=1 Tax=Octopus bimaculoides TaxID=37653 RepID=A0A0L8G9L7_OCTBM
MQLAITTGNDVYWLRLGWVKIEQQSFNIDLHTLVDDQFVILDHFLVSRIMWLLALLGSMVVM